jgi:ribosomal protein S6--L-glutamate ligase
MKIALLARNPHLYSHRRICEAARARGHDIEVLNTLRVSINITSRRPMLFYRKRRLEDFDAVIPRIGASITFYGLAVLRQFEVMGVYPLNESVAIGRSRDKLRCSPAAASAFPSPPTPTTRSRPRTSSISSAERRW